MDNSDGSDCFMNRKPAKNGFLTFLREYSSKKYGMDLVEMSIKGGEAWSKLTSEQKERYQSGLTDFDEWETKNQTSIDDDDKERGSETCCPPPECPKKRKPRSRCPKPKRKSCAKPKRKSCCKPKRKCCPKPACPKSACPKPACPKPACPKPCKRKPSCRAKPHCPKRKPSCCKPKRKDCVPACQNPGPITNNGYLNFLRMYRKKHCGLKPRELVMRAARAWCRLSECKKERYRRLVSMIRSC